MKTKSKNYLWLVFVLSTLLLSCNNDDDQITVAECITPFNLTETNITHLDATLNWEDANPTSIHIIEYGLSGFQIGLGNIVTVTNASVTITGLLPNTTYDYFVKTICDVNNESINSDIKSFTTLPQPVVPEFKQYLSQLNLFAGNLTELNPSIYTFEYDLSTSLYTDYAHKQRLIATPIGENMTYNGDGLPKFPDNTVIAKTFYYFIDDRNESLGKKIIETRLLIKLNGEWQLGNYKWNDAQTDAELDVNGATLPVSWIDQNGAAKSVNYKIPSSQNCFTCHQSRQEVIPIGPKLRSMNFEVNGINQLQALKDRQLLLGLSNPELVSTLPDWEDETVDNETRVRAYLDINCAHCHSAGGFHNQNYYEALNLNFELPFNETHIFEKRNSIMTRIQTSVEGYSMPFLGVSTPHTEAVSLIVNYLETLE